MRFFRKPPPPAPVQVFVVPALVPRERVGSTPWITLTDEQRLALSAPVKPAIDQEDVPGGYGRIIPFQARLEPEKHPGPTPRHDGRYDEQASH